MSIVQNMRKPYSSYEGPYIHPEPLVSTISEALRMPPGILHCCTEAAESKRVPACREFRAIPVIITTSLIVPCS